MDSFAILLERDFAKFKASGKSALTIPYVKRKFDECLASVKKAVAEKCHVPVLNIQFFRRYISVCGVDDVYRLAFDSLEKLAHLYCDYISLTFPPPPKNGLYFQENLLHKKDENEKENGTKMYLWNSPGSLTT